MHGRNRVSKIIRAFLVVAVASLVMVGQAQAGVSCHNIRATGVGQGAAPPGGYAIGTEATIQGGGLLQGTTNAGFNVGALTPTGFEFTGIIEFTTNKATLTAGIEGALDLSTGVFTAEGPVTGATGKLEGATGNLVFEGVQDLGSATGDFVETVTGEICVDLSKQS